MDFQESRQQSATSRIVTTGIASLGLVLLLFHLGGGVMSNDEASYAYRIAGGWRRMFETLVSDNYPIGYFVYMKAWAGLAGIGEAPLRLSSVPFAVATWIVFAWWVRRCLPGDWDRIAFALIVVSPFLLFLERLAKYYSMMSFLSLGSCVLFWRLQEGPEDRSILREKRRLLLFGGASLALAYVHYLGLVQWGAMAGWLLWRWLRGGSRRCRTILAFMTFAAILYVPQLGLLFTRFWSDAEMRIAPLEASAGRRAVIQIGYLVYSFALGHTLEASHVFLGGIGVVAAWAAVVAGAWKAVRRGRGRSPIRADRAAAFSLYFLVAGLAASFVVMWVFLPSLPDLDYSERVCFLFPFVVYLAVYGIADWRRWARWAAGILYACPVLVSLFNLYTLRENNKWDYLIPWREITRTIREEPGRPRAVVVDAFAMGSRGWYYLRDSCEEFVNYRAPAGGVSPAEAAESLAEQGGPLYFLREARDVSPSRSASALEGEFGRRFGRPEERVFVFDSPAMRRIKELVRRGSKVTTLQGKVRLLRFDRGSRP